MEIISETSGGAAERANETRVGAPLALGKRHAATSPAGLDEVLGGGLRDGKYAGAGGTKSGTSQMAAAQPQRQRKHRKSTHVARKVCAWRSVDFNRWRLVITRGLCWCERRRKRGF